MRRLNTYSTRQRSWVWIALAGLLILWPGTALSAPDHQIFANLLAKYNHNGVVDYAGFKQAEKQLDAYLEVLAGVTPDTLSRPDRFAFYANAYNAWTIKLILTGYPGVKSIKDLGSLFRSPWKKKFVRLDGKLVTLDHIEHDILRPQFKDPRVHMAVNCASKGCPPLRAEPFTGDRLDAQLDTAARDFVNNPRYNRLDGDTLYVSRIFKWFSEDFNDDVIGFFIRHARGKLKTALTAKRGALAVEYLDYDWSLNGR